MNCKICNDNVIATIYNGHCSEMCEMQGKINELETKLAQTEKDVKHWEHIATINGRELETVHDQREDLKKKLWVYGERFKMIHAMLSGDGVLGFRVDKAIRTIEEWQGETHAQ